MQNLIRLWQLHYLTTKYPEVPTTTQVHITEQKQGNLTEKAAHQAKNKLATYKTSLFPFRPVSPWPYNTVPAKRALRLLHVPNPIQSSLIPVVKPVSLPEIRTKRAGDPASQERAQRTDQAGGDVTKRRRGVGSISKPASASSSICPSASQNNVAGPIWRISPTNKEGGGVCVGRPGVKKPIQQTRQPNSQLASQSPALPTADATTTTSFLHDDLHAGMINARKRDYPRSRASIPLFPCFPACCRCRFSNLAPGHGVVSSMPNEPNVLKRTFWTSACSGLPWEEEGVETQHSLAALPALFGMQ
ncbi:hypothetical protein VTJ04DRAFT_8607 [Mycothermus thermophilus]|uniref:uncharacterized protein n=1 Tax=Humicola insolens TaxID=85995 RepID=UPI00374349C6